MTVEEKEYLEARLETLKSFSADTTNRIKILQERRKEINREYRGIRARLVRLETEEVADW